MEKLLKVISGMFAVCVYLLIILLTAYVNMLIPCNNAVNVMEHLIVCVLFAIVFLLSVYYPVSKVVSRMTANLAPDDETKRELKRDLKKINLLRNNCINKRRVINKKNARHAKKNK